MRFISIVVRKSKSDTGSKGGGKGAHCDHHSSGEAIKGRMAVQRLDGIEAVAEGCGVKAIVG